MREPKKQPSPCRRGDGKSRHVDYTRPRGTFSRKTAEISRVKATYVNSAPEIMTRHTACDNRPIVDCTSQPTTRNLHAALAARRLSHEAFVNLCVRRCVGLDVWL